MNMKQKKKNWTKGKIKLQYKYNFLPIKYSKFVTC